MMSGKISSSHLVWTLNPSVPILDLVYGITSFGPGNSLERLHAPIKRLECGFPMIRGALVTQP